MSATHLLDISCTMKAIMHINVHFIVPLKSSDLSGLQIFIIFLFETSMFSACKNVFKVKMYGVALLVLG